MDQPLRLMGFDEFSGYGPSLSIREAIQEQHNAVFHAPLGGIQPNRLPSLFLCSQRNANPSPPRQPEHV